MPIEIFGDFDKDQLYCVGSFTKTLTTFVSLSYLSEKYDLENILDDENFLDSISTNPQAESFLKLFKKLIGAQFTLRDICTYYNGLPYTFDPTNENMEHVDAGNSFIHHSILDEKTFLYMCENKITPVYRNRSKFHYSEISIIMLAYLIEKISGETMENLYKKYVIDKFHLPHSQLSRTRPEGVYIQDLSDKFDYPAVAIQHHGYFCYSNGFYSTLNDMKTLLEGLTEDEIFKQMISVQKARCVSEELMNGLTIELRVTDDDLIFGYDGLSFSGANAWSYSSKLKQGYLTFCNDADVAYEYIYKQLGVTNFNKIPEHTQHIYTQFLKDNPPVTETRDIPYEFQGNYQRVLINDKMLENISVLGNTFLKVRNPEEITYDIVYSNQNYHMKDDDQRQNSKIGMYRSNSGKRYMFFDGNLYKRIEPAAANEEKPTENTRLSKTP